MATEINIQESVCLKNGEKEESAFTSESFEEKVTELPGNKVKQLETISQVVVLTVNTPLETSKPSDESGIFFQALSVPMVNADEHSNTPESCKAAKQTETEEETVEKAIESEVREEDAPEKAESEEVSEQCEIRSMDIEEQKSEESVKKIEKAEEIKEIKQDVETEKLEQNGSSQAITSDACISTQTKSNVETTEHEQKDEDVNVLEEDQDKDDTASVQEVTFEGGLQEKYHHSGENENEVVEAKGSIYEDTDVCVATQTELVKESIKNEETSEEKAPEKEVPEKNGTNKAESEGGLEIYDSMAPSQKETLNMLEKDQGDSDGVTSSQEAPFVGVEGTTTVQHATTVIDFKEQDLNEKPREFIEEETEDKSLDAQEASKECEKEAKEETEQDPEESVQKFEKDEETEQSVSTDVFISTQTKSQEEKTEHEGEKSDTPLIKEVCEETDSEKVVHEKEVKDSAVAIINKDDNEDKEKEQEVNVLEKDEGEDDVTSAQDVTFVKDVQEKNHHNEDDESEVVTAEEITEKDTEVILSSEKTEQEEYTEEIKPSVKTTEEKDVCISTQIESQEEATKNEENDIENDDDQKEKTDDSFVNEVCKENDLKKTESEETIHLSDSSDVKTRESLDADTEETRSSVETKENEEQQGLLHVITTDVCSSTHTEHIAKTTEGEENNEEETIENDGGQTEKPESPLVEVLCEATSSDIAEYEEGVKHSDSFTTKSNVNETLSKEEQKEEEIKTSEVQGGGDDVTSSHNASNEDIKETTIGEHDTIVTYVEEGQGVSATPKEILIEKAEDTSVDAQEVIHVGTKQEPVEEESDPDGSKEKIIDSNETTEVEPQEDITTSNSLETSTEDASNSEVEKAEGEKLPIEDLETVSEVQIPELVPKSEESVLKEECIISEMEAHLDEEKETVTKEISSDEKTEVQGGGDDVTSTQNASSENIQETTVDQHDTTLAYVEEAQAVSATAKEILIEQARDKSIDAEEISLELGQPNEQNVEETHPYLTETISQNSEDEIKKEDKYLSPESVEDTNDDITREEKSTFRQELVEEHSDRDEVSKEKVSDLNETTEAEPQEDITPSTLVETSTEDASNSEKEKAESENLPVEDLETVSEVHILESVPKLEDSMLKEDCLISETETQLDEENGIITKENSSDEVQITEQTREIKQETVKEVFEETGSEKAEIEEALKHSDSSDMKINEEGITTSKDNDQEKDHEVNISAESQSGDNITSSQKEVSEENKDLLEKNHRYEDNEDDLIKSGEGVDEDTEEVKSSVETKENTEDVITTDVSSSTHIQLDEETIENEEKNHEKAMEYDENETVSREENLEKKQEDVEETKMDEHATTTEIPSEEEGDKYVVAQEETEQYDDGANDKTEQKTEECSNEINISVETNEEKATKNEEQAIESDGDQKEKSENPFVKEVCEENDLKKTESEEEIQLYDNSNVKTRETEDEDTEETKYSDETKENMEPQGLLHDVTTPVCSSTEIEDTEKTTQGEVNNDEKAIENDDGQTEKPESPLVEAVCEATSSEMAQSDEGVSTTLNENETLSKEEKLEEEHEIKTTLEVQGGKDDIASSQNASNEEVEETIIAQHDTDVAFVEEGQGVSAIPKEILIEKEDKSTNVEEVSLELGQPIEQDVEETNPCLTETTSQNPEDEIKKEEKVFYPESVEDTNDHTAKEEKCTLEQEPEKEQSDRDDVSKEMVINSNETTEVKPQEDITPSNPLETSTEDTSNSGMEKEESEKLPIEALETVSEVQNTESVPKSEDSMQQEECFISETETHLEEGKETVTKELLSDEKKEQTTEMKQETVKEVCEETSSEKAEFEGLELSDSSDIKIIEKGTAISKDDEQEKDQEVNVLAESQGEDNITSSQNEVSEEKEDLQEKNYHNEDNEDDFIKSREGVDEDTEEIKYSVDTKENTEHVITTNVCSSTEVESNEENLENEEKNCEKAIQDYQIEIISREENLEKKQEDVCSSAQTEPKEETIYNEEATSSQNASTEDTKETEISGEEAEAKSVHVQKVSKELGQTKEQNVEEIQACLTETISEITEDKIRKKDEDLSHDSIEHEPLEEQNDSLDEVSKEKFSDSNETTAVEPQEAVMPSSSLETSTEDTSNSDKTKTESENLSIEDLETVSEPHIPEVMPISEYSKMKEECLISETTISADEENGTVTKEISSDENLGTHESTQQPENLYITTEENVTHLEQIGEINPLYENRDMKEDVTQESQLNSTEDCSEMVKDVILTEEIEQVPVEIETEKGINDFKEQTVEEDSYSVELQEKSEQNQKEIVHEIPNSDSILVENPEVTEVNVDAQRGEEDLQGKEHISCASKVTNEVDQEPKEEIIPSVEDSTTVESPVDLSNIESTAYPLKVTNEVDQEPQALESDHDVEIPEVVADSEESKVKEECIVLATDEYTDKNNVEEQDTKINEISSATDAEQEHVTKAPTKSDEANSSDLIIEEKSLTKENLEMHEELQPTSEPVIEDQVTIETKPQPEQSDITSENIMSDHSLESKLEQTSGKDLEDGKEDIKEDVTLATDNEIKSIENQNETTKNIILSDEIEQVAVETEKENERNDIGQGLETDNCPTELNNTLTPNKKELANEIEYSKAIPVGNTEVTEVKAESQIEVENMQDAEDLSCPSKASSIIETSKVETGEDTEHTITFIEEVKGDSIDEASKDKSVPDLEDSKASGNEAVEDVIINEVLLEDEKVKESQSVKDIINEETKLNQLSSDTDEVNADKEKGTLDEPHADDSAKTTYDSVLSSTEQDIEARSESRGHGDMLKLEEKPTEVSEVATDVVEKVPEHIETSATDVKTREQGELVHCGSQEPSEDNTLLSQNDKNTEDPDVLPSVEKDVTEGVDKRFEEALVLEVQKHERDLDHETEIGIADVVSNVECSEIEPPQLDTKEATLELIKQENQREQKKEADESIEAVIPVEDVKTSTRKPEVGSVDLDVPSVTDATADKEIKTVEGQEAGKGLLKDDEHLESTIDQSKPIEEGSGLIQEPLELDAPRTLGPAATEDLKISQRYATDDLINLSQTHHEIQKDEVPAYTVDKQQSPNEPHPKESTESKILTESVEPAKLTMANVLYEPAKGNSEVAENLTGERDSALTKDQQVKKEEIGESGVQTEEEEEDDEKIGSGSDAPVMVEASRDMEEKVHKKSHNILSGVGSKVKHSIAKVKKAITGKSSPPKTPSPKAKNQVID